MTSHPVLVTTSSFAENDPAPREALLEAGFQLHRNPWGRKLTEAEVLELLRTHRPIGMIAGVEPLTRGVLEDAAPFLKVISRCGTGLDNVDLSAADRLGIRIFNTPNAVAAAVAELTVGLMLSVLRRIPEADRALRGGSWKALQGTLLGGKTVGIVGFGRVGQRVAALLGGFGCRILVNEPAACELPVGTESVELDALLSRADVVSLHIPLSSETRALVNRGRLARMKKGAVLINTSRGGLVDEDGLADALRSGGLAGAGLDVYDSEPYSGPLTGLPNAVLTSHMGSAARECRIRMEQEAASNLISGLRAAGVL